MDLWLINNNILVCTVIGFHKIGRFYMSKYSFFIHLCLFLAILSRKLFENKERSVSVLLSKKLFFVLLFIFLIFNHLRVIYVSLHALPLILILLFKLRIGM